MRVGALIAALIALSFVFWEGWFVLFGSPEGGMRYVALALCLVLLRLGAMVFARVYPKP